jgi:hypothetical protein
VLAVQVNFSPKPNRTHKTGRFGGISSVGMRRSSVLVQGTGGESRDVPIQPKAETIPSYSMSNA